MQTPEYVFVYSQVCSAGKQPQFWPIETMNNTSRQKARRRTKPAEGARP